MKFRFTFLLNVILICALGLIQKSSTAQTIAFPGAEGAGKFTSGGRGTTTVPTTVFEVTNLTDVNSAGSLRYACSQSTTTYPYRTIVFRVSGTIHLNSRLSIPKNTTIAGQTAPGDGVCIADYPVVVSGDNVIIRYIRCRMGDKNQTRAMVDGAGSDDALGNLGSKNLIIDHCSVSWSTDEALTVYRGDSVTLQWNLISEPLNYSYHFETGDTDFEHHGYGGIWGGKHGSFHHNLIAHCKNRTPRFSGVSTYVPAVQGAEMCDFRNNVLYDWGINNVYGGEGGYYNIVNNYYKAGPSTTSRRYQVVAVDSSEEFPYAKYYIKGNYIVGSTANTNNNWLSVSMKSGRLADTVKSKVSVPFDLPAITTETALNAYTNVLAGVGVSFPKRDTLDERIINDVKNGTGRLIDVQGGYPHGTAYEKTVNAWPTLNSTTAPTDSDHDGMPDTWETANGLNPSSSADRNTRNSDGYTMLEVYLNSLLTASTGTGNTGGTTGGTGTGDPGTGGTGTGASFTVTWPLATNQSATVTGSATATDQSTPMYVNNYQSFTPTSGIYVGQTIYGQRIKLGSATYWPASQTGDVSNQYVEYTVTPTGSGTNNVNYIAVDFGPTGSTEAMKANIYYSLDGFATAGVKLNSDPLTMPTFSSTNGGDSWSSIKYSNLGITVPAGKTLSLRIYQYWTSASAASSSKYFVERSVVIASATPLPLNLLSFTGDANLLNKQVELRWLVNDEKNTSNFIIERGDNNSNSFSKLGEVKAKNVAGNNTYVFTDPSPLKVTAYYKLRITDKDGSYRYSNLISVKSPFSNEISLYPNPAKDKLKVTLKSAISSDIAVIDVLGKKVLSQSLAGSLSSILDVSGLAPGVYFIILQDETGKRTERFIKE